jgi:hypothetical protein
VAAAHPKKINPTVSHQKYPLISVKMKSPCDCSITSFLFAIIGIGLFGNILICSAMKPSSSFTSAAATLSSSDSGEPLKIHSLHDDRQTTFSRPSTVGVCNETMMMMTMIIIIIIIIISAFIGKV